MHEIYKEINERLNLMVLKCTEGCKITSWNEGDDIMEYTSFSVAYCPIDADTSIYHCVSMEDDEKYMAEQLKQTQLQK
jgi:hypothetical protein